jgi:tetratricopeptide (TPR) repeat protein
MTDHSVSDVGGGARAGDERWYLNDQRDFLLRSIADAHSEHHAGDLSDEDFSLLVARDRRRLAEVELALGELAPPPPSPSLTPPPPPSPPPAGTAPGGPAPPLADAPKMSRWRLLGILSCCALIVIGILILVDHAISPRLPGQAVSGGITQTRAQLIEQQLAQAATLYSGGQTAQALTLYEKVLSEDPTDPTALAQSGWLEWNAGASDTQRSLETLGRRVEEQAIRVAPNFYGGHLYLGLILLYQDNNPKGAVVQFDKFLADAPPLAQVHAAAPKIKDAYRAAGLPIPAALTAPG